MSAKRKHRPNWDSGFFMARADPEWKPAGRRESERPAELDEPFSFDWKKCRKAWEAIGVTWLKEGDMS